MSKRKYHTSCEYANDGHIDELPRNPMALKKNKKHSKPMVQGGPINELPENVGRYDVNDVLKRLSNNRKKNQKKKKRRINDE